MPISLIKQIHDLVKILGNSHDAFYPTSYATAWVSRVPSAGQLKSPAFPQSLEWLRAHQLSDGSWGSITPFNPFANTLCTFASLLALKQWDFAQDQEAIQKGLASLAALSLSLSDEKNKTFGFEALLSAFVEEAQLHNFSISESVLNTYQKYIDIGKNQRQVIQIASMQTPSVFWLCLEMLGGSSFTNVNKACLLSQDRLSDNGSLLSSVTATAYLLASHRYNDSNLPLAHSYLEHMLEQNNGGASPYFPMEQYELSFALDFFLKGGIPIYYLQQPIKQLHHTWNKRNGLGYSIFSPSIDADDSALGCIILKKNNLPVNYQSLLEFFNGSYFCHYKEDPTPSLSVNANVIRALLHFSHVSEIKTTFNKTWHWMEKTLENPLDEVFYDTWHLSPYYSAQSVIFALRDIAPDTTKRCINWVIKNQRNDGGWGHFGISSTEETALAILSLLHYRVCGHDLNMNIFARAREYLNYAPKIEAERYDFYKGTTTVHPIYVVKATILAAKYGIESLFYAENGT